jgi:hypothetical protein
MLTHIHNFEQFINESLTGTLFGYHVTRRANVDSIKGTGLQPRIPVDYGEDGDVEAVYLFKNIEDVENALYNWLGERIDEWEEESGDEYDEVVLKVNLSGLEEYLVDSVEYEWMCVCDIEPSRIIDIMEM